MRSNIVSPLDKQKIRRAFDRAATSYDGAAVLQRQIGEQLVERLELIKLQPATIIDVGCGTGYLLSKLAKRYNNATLCAIDIAPNMLQQAKLKQSWWDKTFQHRQQYICADSEILPLQDNSCDLILSNLAIQWSCGIHKTLSEFYRVIRPGGLLMFTTFGPDTLKELRSSWQQVDHSIHVHEFIDMHVIGDLLLQLRFADPVMDVDYYTLTYPDVFQLMRELKALGASNASTQRSHALTGKQHLKAMQTAYETYRQDDVLPATYEVVFGHAWIPQNKPGTDFVNVEFRRP